MLRRDFVKSAGALAVIPWLPALSMPDDQRQLPQFSEMAERLKNAPKITHDDFQARLAKLQEALRNRQLAGLFLEPSENLHYLMGWRFGRSERLVAAFIPAIGQPLIFGPAFEEPLVRKASGFEKVYTWEDHENPYAVFAKLLGDHGLRTGTMAIEPTTRYFVIDGLSRELPQAKFVNGEAVCNAQRMIKSEKEIMLMRLANDATEACIRQAWRQIKPGMTEQEVSRLVQQNFAALGLSGGGLIQFGPSSANPHGGATPRSLQSGEIVLMDCGTKVQGYTSDVTRTTVLGEPSPRQQEIWWIVHRAQSAAIAAAKPAVTCESVDAAARQVIAEAGYGKYFVHRLGHGIGLEGHEAPYFAGNNKTILQPGMTFTVEPGIYIQGEFGVRLEDDIVITDNGCDLLTVRMEKIEPIQV
ncbi:MAG: Xaa-Pro peptidase family protein [candidate division KSB1 bacterium]|nr:Xaa-Pro peptidase family protein [candidate division KSB1 bacterium]MDZ7304252.1 Xaa-Pro peptidase family protein [candidate division KSB1 bacterium]MDZ7311727.1 Xaa-Pro peptidase family protein [candidate division KSB1 bacterium]